jgi:hypothetical protein
MQTTSDTATANKDTAQISTANQFKPRASAGAVATRATYTGPLQNGIIEVIARFAGLTTPCWLEFHPNGLWLQLERGLLVGSQGGEPLGQLLIAQGVISETMLSEALRLQGERPLGLVLSGAPFDLPAETVRRTLERQLLGVLDKLLLNQPRSYSFYRASSAVPLYPRVAVSAIEKRSALAAGHDDSGLPLHESWRMGALSGDETLTPDEWAVCRMLNGRRTLAQVLERLASLENGLVRGREATQSLFKRGLLEPSAVMGLQTIVLSRKREVGASYHPPAGMIANLFLRQLDGTQDAFRIGSGLKVDPDRAAAIVAGLYRDNVVDVVRGGLELARLLEDY